MNVDALCVGLACWDLAMSVDRFPAENSKAETDTLAESGGGPAANAAWLLGHWGVPTALAALVGTDDYGRLVVEDLERVGVQTAWIERRPEHPTPVSFVLINRANGSRTIVNRKHAVTLPGLPRQHLSGLNPRLLLFDGHEPQAALDALEAFPDALSVLDAGSLRAGTQALADRVRYLACSERYAAQVTGFSDVANHWQECLQRLRPAPDHVVVVTMGERGLAFDDGQRRGRMPALAVQAVDTTGAGDVFHGAFAYALLRQMPLEEALGLATVAAGLSVQRAGGRASIPSLPEVLNAFRHG